MLNHPHIQAWQQSALTETRIIEEDEAGEIISIAGILASK
jgi:glutathione S-transferase